jgi:predicted nuclease with TOPRIM domain
VENENELIAQELSALAERFMRVENRVADLLTRMTDVEKVNSRLEEAALTTARALAEVSGHWDAVYEAMRRRDPSQDGSKSW